MGNVVGVIGAEQMVCHVGDDIGDGAGGTVQDQVETRYIDDEYLD